MTKDSTHRPIDPRSRRVIGTSRGGLNAVTLHLDCGHTVSRKPLCVPRRAICDHCPPAGGIKSYIPHPSHGAASTPDRAAPGAGKSLPNSTSAEAGR